MPMRNRKKKKQLGFPQTFRLFVWCLLLLLLVIDHPPPLLVLLLVILHHLTFISCYSRQLVSQLKTGRPTHRIATLSIFVAFGLGIILTWCRQDVGE